MEGLIEGRIVHYIPFPHELFRFPNEHRPAIVVKVWPGGECVQLQVFIDGSNDIPAGDPEATQSAVWRTSIRHSEDKEPGTWHWIEKV